MSCSELRNTPSPPTLEVLLGPAGAGKSAACLARFRAAKGNALLLVPSRAYAERMRQRLVLRESDPEPAAHADNILPFTEAAKELAKVVCPKPEPIRRSQQWLILSEIFAGLVEDDAFFRRMKDAPGFVPALADSLRELKLSGINPEDLKAAANALDDSGALREVHPNIEALLGDPSFARKVREVAQLYGAYQRFLTENHLLDEEEVCRLAIDAIPRVESGKLAPRLVLVDGFYRISRLWRDLLGAFARRGAEVIVTLTAEESRPLLFATPLRTLAQLKEEFQVREVRLTAPAVETTPSPLGMLERSLFAPALAGGAERVPALAAGEHPSPPPILLLDAPNPYTEVEMIARELVKERQERAVPWKECALVVRSVGDYAPLISGVFARYEIPFAFRRGKPLPENPAVRTLSRMLRIYLRGWQRDDMIAFLRSGGVCGRGVGFDAVRVLARSRGVREGKSAWESLLPRIQEKNEAAGSAIAQLIALDAALPKGADTYERMEDFVIQAVTAFGLDRAEGTSDAAREDRAAMSSALEVVRQIVSHARLAGMERVTFGEFHRRLNGLLHATVYLPIEPQNAVSVIEPYDSQQLRPRVVFIPGLTERLFPRRIMEDPFFRDDERDALGLIRGLQLEPQRTRSDDERLLFYMAVTLPAERLVLSYPRASEESDTLPSFFLDEARAALAAEGYRLPAVVRRLSDVAPTREECATERDRLLSACAAVGDRGDTENLDPALAAILETRLRPPTPTLSVEAAAALSDGHRYSVTEIETYHRCPFQHFATYGLKLRAEQDGAGAADRGALHHETLRRTLRAIARDGETQDKHKLKESLLRQLVDCMNERTVDARPHRRSLMERAVRSALEVCAEREERYRDLFGMSPAHFELAFGVEAPDEPEEDGRSRDYDPASTRQPLVIAGEDGASIHLCGAIDRVDVAPDGRTALVLDYKMGSTHEWAKIREGTSIQIPFYLMAVEQLWGMVGAVGCYDSPRDSGRRRFYRKECVDVRTFQPLAGVEDGRMAKPVAPDEYREALEAAQQTVRSAVAGIRAGRIAPQPGDHCRWCDFVDVCRTSPDGVYDGAPTIANDSGARRA